MEFRKRSEGQFGHFLFYPDRHSEAKALEQCQYVYQQLACRLKQKQINFLIAGHLFKCLRQCGFDDDDINCIARTCEEQKDDKHYGKCKLFSYSDNVLQLQNHMHVLIHVPTDVTADSNFDHHRFASSAAAAKATNWCFEAAVKEVSTFFTETMCGDGYRNFRVLQKTVWCPFSIYATFAPYKNSLIIMNGDVFEKKMKKQWITNLDCRKNFPKTPPVVRSKTVFEFHCH